MGQFATAFDGKAVAEITATEIDEWLRGLPVAPITRNNFGCVLIVAFNFAKARGYCLANHAGETASKAKQIEGEVEILTVNELTRLLESADTKIVPFIAIGAFAGLRRAELERLDWSEVDLPGRLIQVTAKKAKKRTQAVREDRTELLQYGSLGTPAPKALSRLPITASYSMKHERRRRLRPGRKMGYATPSLPITWQSSTMRRRSPSNLDIPTPTSFFSTTAKR